MKKFNVKNFVGIAFIKVVVEKARFCYDMDVAMSQMKSIYKDIIWIKIREPLRK